MISSILIILYTIIQTIIIIINEIYESGISSIITILLCFGQTILLYKMYIKTELNNKEIVCKKLLGMLLVSTVIICFVLMSVVGFILFFYIDTSINYNYIRSNVGEILTIILFYPIAEELICRGVLLNQLSKKKTFLISNIIQALLFSILHLSISHAIIFFSLGLLLGVIKRYFNIFCSIYIHMIYNLFMYLCRINVVNFPGLSKWIYLSFGIIFFVLIVCVMFKLRKRYGAISSTC